MDKPDATIILNLSLRVTLVQDNLKEILFSFFKAQKG